MPFMVSLVSTYSYKVLKFALKHSISSLTANVYAVICIALLIPLLLELTAEWLLKSYLIIIINYAKS